MSTVAPKTEFTLRGFNPDVLTCIANLSNDEVFTPPSLANEMLDTVEVAWAEANGGKSIWSDSSVTFLDPFTKSGVFLREIIARLTVGLEDEIPDLQARVDHILTKQVFGIAITTLTSLLARRSVYCSKDATGPHSIAKSFDRHWGNIWFERTEHTWAKRKTERRIDATSAKEVVVEVEGTGSCRHCGAAEAVWGRGQLLESHAYAFIHTDDINARITELFGAEMQFDVIIGNPPYQLNTDQTDTKITGTIPLYHLFVEQAKRLEPRFLSMVVPARWIAGGRGLDDFRENMLGDRRISEFVDYPIASEVFGNGVEIGGGICYLLWDRHHDGPAAVTTVRGDQISGPVERDLGKYDVFVRDNAGAIILEKIVQHREPAVSEIASGQKPFGISTNFNGYKSVQGLGDVAVHYVRPGKRLVGFMAASAVEKGAEYVDVWKVLTPEASDGRGTVGFRPAVILGRPIISGPREMCTNTYLVVGPFESREASESFVSYYRTKFFRFLVSLRKISQHASNFTYTWVPVQSWDRTWTDEALYAKYGLTPEEQAYIESQIKPMDLTGDDDVED